MRKGLKQQWQLPKKTLQGSPVEWILRQRGQDPDEFMRTELAGLASYLGTDGLDGAAELVSRHVLAGNRILLVADYGERALSTWFGRAIPRFWTISTRRRYLWSE